MQRKNFPFERWELKQQTPTMLFKKSELGQVEFLNVSTSLLPQFNLFRKHQFDGDPCNSSFKTPPMEKKFVVTPKAPIKNKIVSKRADLKPKKLQYSEEEPDSFNVVHKSTDIVSDQSSNALLSKRNTVKHNRPDITQKQTTRSHTKLDKIKTQTIDKENDRSVIKNRSKNTSNTSNNVTEVSSIVFDSNTEILSQHDNNLNWKEKLYWLQKRRDIGLWVECCRPTCKKWRYVEDYHDPIDVPKKWYCEMNSDKSIASCTIAEVPKTPAIEADLIENEYNAGSIVWAYVPGFPWWPAIINDSPETFTYYILQGKSQKPIKYYVTFFFDKLECMWINRRNIKPFAQTEYRNLVKKTKFYGIDYRNSLNKAYELASSALSLSISERLQKYSYIALCEKMFDINNNVREPINMPEAEMDTNSDEEIPPSNPTNSFSLKDYYFTVLCRIHDTQTSDNASSFN